MDTNTLLAQIMRKGGTLLAEPCPKCGGLMVKYKGKTFCPKCDNITSIEQLEKPSKKDEDVEIIQQQIIKRVKELLNSKKSDPFISESLLYYAKALVELRKLSEKDEGNNNT